MKRVFITAGNISGLIGILMCGTSGVSRILGHFHTLSYENMTIFNAGIGLMVFCMLIKQELILWSSQSS